ncbi:MAG: glycoside hydrolase family 3 protein [Clostridia bacterium]|nr:glycoside hydrolase family 3 protein [Clostridia bacterium]
MLAMLFILSGCSADEVPTANTVKTLNELTLEEKIGQMIQVERSALSLTKIETLGIGSVLSGGGSIPGNGSISAWNEMMTEYAEASAGSSSGISVIYGIDAVHGNNNVITATIFPHNIGLGAANDPELLRKIGQATAEEMKVMGAHMNFAPAVSVIRDKRWGRTYEGYSEDPEIVSRLGSAYIEGLKGVGIITTAKHFIGDGYVEYGTGEGANLIDRGNVVMPLEDMMAVYGPVYQSAIDAGVDAIMVSFSSVAGEKMHGNEHLLTTVLRDEMNFDGVVISDWEGIHALPGLLEDQVVKAVNAGIDLLMQPYNGEETYNALLKAARGGRISEERIDGAVSRILKMKEKAGLLDAESEASEYKMGSEFAVTVAREAVAKSQVLLKNEGVLPLKEDQRVYVMGPDSDNIGIQCGGWTVEWQGTMTEEFSWGDSILDAFEQTSDFVVDCPDEADVIVLVIGEKPYAEMFGDTDDASLSGPMSLNGNLKAAELAKTYGKPVVTLIVAGRPLEIEEHLNNWDALVMSFLPGTEALGITDVLYGKVPFTGKLPITWPKETSSYDITFMDSDCMDEVLFPLGYGLE